MPALPRSMQPGAHDVSVDTVNTPTPFIYSRSMETDADLRLSDAEIDEFFDLGWITRRDMFGAEEIARMRTCFDALERIGGQLNETGLHTGSHFVLGDGNGGSRVRRVVWAGGSQPYLLEVGADRRLTIPVSQLLGSTEMDQLLSQAHFKRPGDGVIFDWHQDIQHRDKGPGTWDDVNGSGSFVQTIIVMDEMTPESGTVLFIPGSSKWGRVDLGEHDYDRPESPKKRPPQFREEDAVTITAAAGDGLFFGPYTVHASFENSSHHDRRVFINGYAYPGANHRVYPGDGAGRMLKVG